MADGHVLVALEGSRLRRCRVDQGPVRVPWAPGVRAEPAAGGVVLAGPGVVGSTRRLAAGGATPVGDSLTSCLAIEPQPEGMPAVVLGPDLVAVSDGMTRVLHAVACLAPMPDAVTLVGESGTGKELVARALHDLGRGPGRPFVPVHLAAVPAELIEAELFGWVRGAFTGASDARAGAFEQAAAGTLFLDEVTETPVFVQAKLLRAVETGLVQRIGAARAMEPGARVVSATNRDPGEAVGSGAFRLDLLERLACLVVRVPPLRTRPDDLAPIARRLCSRMPERPVPEPAALDALAGYPWPGNVRELRNVLRRAVVLSRCGTLTAGAVGDAIEAGRLERPAAGAWPVPGCADGPAGSAWGRPDRTAQIAASGLPRSTFYYRLKRGRVPGV